MFLWNELKLEGLQAASLAEDRDSGQQFNQTDRTGPTANPGRGFANVSDHSRVKSQPSFRRSAGFTACLIFAAI